MDAYDTESPPRLHAVFVERGPLAEAVLGDAQHRTARPRNGHRHHLVAWPQPDATHAARDPAHCPQVALGKPDRLPLTGADEDLAGAAGQLGAHHDVLVAHPHRDDAVGARMPERLEVDPLDDPLPGAHDDEPAAALGRELPDGLERRDLLVRPERHQVRDRLAAAGGTDIRNPMHLEPVHPAPRGEDQDVGVRRRDEDVGQKILVARAHPDPALAAAALVAVLRQRRALDVSGVADRDGDILVGDQILDAEIALRLDDLRAPFVTVRLAHLPQLVDDDLQQQHITLEDGPQTFDRPVQVGQLVEHLLPLESGQALQLHVQDGLRLNPAERKIGDQTETRRRRRLRRPDEGDHRIEVIERRLETLEDVRARLRFPQVVLGAAPDHVAPELDEPVDEIEQRQFPRAAVGDRQGDDAERRLQCRVLVQVVEQHLRHFAAAQLDHDAHAVAVGLVAQVGNALDHLVTDQLRDFLEQPGLVDLIGDFTDDNRLPLALAALLYRRARTEGDGSAAGVVRLRDTRAADDEPTGREIGTGHQPEQLDLLLEARRIGMFRHPDGAVDHLAQVVRRDVGRHADRDPGRAVHQQVWERRRQHRRLGGRFVVVRDEVDRVLVEIGHQLVGHRLQPRFRVAHRRGRIAVHRAEVSLAVHQGIAHVEVLRHADQRVVNRCVAVRMEVAHHLADDLRALAVGPVRGQPHRAHAIDHSPVGRLQTVPDIRQSAADDDAHGVVHVGPAHLVFDADGNVGAFDIGHGVRRVGLIGSCVRYPGSSRRARDPR